MSRTFVVCIGFNTPEMIAGAFINADKTIGFNTRVVKWFFDPGYPNPSREENMKQNRALCSEYGWIYTPIENEGVLGNWNKIIHEYLNMEPQDFLFTFDPDVRMNKWGWIIAMREALESDPKAKFCSSALDFHEHDWMSQSPYNRKVTTLDSGLRIARYDCLIAWASGMWRADFLISRDRNFGAKGKYYGWNEHADYERLLAHGFTWISAADFIDNHMGAPDSKYVEWKQRTAAGIVDVKFEEWIKDEHQGEVT